MSTTTYLAIHAARAALADAAAHYAEMLIEAGFTVYLPVKPRPGLNGWFHYSREVDGQTCYGTYSDGSQSTEGPSNAMPIKPSRLNGSSATIGAKAGDAATLGLDRLPVESVAMAEAVARPENWCPLNAEPTPEAVRYANSERPVPQRFYKGATLRNAEPWGIGTTYLPAAHLAPGAVRLAESLYAHVYGSRDIEPEQRANYLADAAEIAAAYPHLLSAAERGLTGKDA